MANKFIRFEGYWISCTNPELITKFDNLEVALLALKEKHQQGYENYGITKSRGRYELRKYHPEPYGKNPGFQKTNERSHLTITIGNIKLYYHCEDETERQAIKSETLHFTMHKNWTADKIGRHITWIYKGL